jgi:hypothetical protein
MPAARTLAATGVTVATRSRHAKREGVRYHERVALSVPLGNARGGPKLRYASNLLARARENSPRRPRWCRRMFSFSPEGDAWIGCQDRDGFRQHRRRIRSASQYPISHAPSVTRPAGVVVDLAQSRMKINRREREPAGRR